MGCQRREDTTPHEVTGEEADQHADVHALRVRARSSLQRYCMNSKALCDPSLPLATATAQDIHVALRRRREHNAVHGASILVDLLAQRQDWQAVLVDTYGLATDRGGPTRLPGCARPW